MDERLLRRVDTFALREMHKRDALDAYRAGRATLRDFARALGLDLWAAHDLLRAEGVAVAQGDRMETGAALESALRAITPP
jgi:hypothetical protein